MDTVFVLVCAMRQSARVICKDKQAIETQVQCPNAEQ